MAETPSKTKEKSAEKKRKRHSEKDEGPRKKAAIDNEDGARVSSRGEKNEGSKVKIVLLPSDSKFPLVIGSAPGLSLSNDFAFNAFHDQAKDELLLHSSKHPRLDYIGRQRQEGGDEEDTKHYVAFFDHSTKEVQYVEARPMTIRKTVAAEQEEVRKDRQAVLPDRGKTAQHELATEFGNKKARKAMEDMVRNTITPTKIKTSTDDPEAARKALKSDPRVAATLESMASSAATAPSKAQIQKDVEGSKPRPEAHLDASEAEDVYRLDDIVPKSTLEKLKVKPWFEAIDLEQPVETPSRFVSSRLKNIIEKDDVEKAKVLKYILVVLKFFRATGRLKSKSRRVPKMQDLVARVGEDEKVVEAVRDQFVAGADMTKWEVHNLITHLCVATLIVDSFETDVSDLQDDLDLEPAEMRKYFHEVGIKLKVLSEKQRSNANLSKEEAKTHRMAKLVLPLVFPKQATPRARKA